MKMVNIPTYKMSSNFLLREDFDIYLLKHHDSFFRRIIEHVQNRLDSIERDSLLCKIQDEDGYLYELRLPEDGFSKALQKALDYFKKIEDYEICQVAIKLKTYIND
jgi:hypothetical protein